MPKKSASHIGVNQSGARNDDQVAEIGASRPHGCTSGQSPNACTSGNRCCEDQRSSSGSDFRVTALRVLFSMASVGVATVVVLVLVSAWPAVAGAAGVAIGVVGAITTGALAAAAKFAGRGR